MGVTFSCTCPGALQGEGWVGRGGYITPQSACPCEEAAETAAGRRAAGGTRRHTTLLGKATSMDTAWAQRVLQAGPAGWSCRLQEGQGEFSPLDVKQILPADGGRSWIKHWVSSGCGRPQAGPWCSCGQAPGLLLVVPELELRRWQTRCQISSISLISEGSLSPAATCPCRRRCCQCPLLAAAPLSLARNSRLPFPFCKPLKKHLLAGW